MHARIQLLTVAALALAACSDPAPGSSSGGDSGVTDEDGGAPICPDLAPATCPTGAPTYAKDVAPIVKSTCAVCHSPGGMEASRAFTTYDEVFAQRGAMFSQVNACRMPPRYAPKPLAVDDRKTLLTWLVCGAPHD